ncbi:unnamed protein product [Penicillium manginii]
MVSEAQGTPNFGRRYAILNLDWMALLLSAIEGTPEGQSLIENYKKWNEAVHKKSPRPLTIFTTLAFAHGQPEVERGKPFSKLIAPFGDFKAGTPETEIDTRFTVNEQDIVLTKTRCSATSGSALEQILKAQNIDTVVISGLSLSGVIMSTVYHLFDLDYNIYVIEDNVLELPPSDTAEFKALFVQKILPRMNLQVISLETALRALEQSS